MKELEKNFYGAVAAYDKAMKPEADKDELARALWRCVPPYIANLYGPVERQQAAPPQVVGNAS